ncbi:hypothetical protein [Rubricoccus marinus]|uniref:Uncharacterized protein n=1 Tax=Rubricoccus marinus TaxID=716817 RepID=A0A259U2U7_9BACT|nr:hypothetical protein [Rubricoccus marinus]OZC04311.1 hypothetical protein BSZ36_15775 [Rubricoccus marinus]
MTFGTVTSYSSKRKTGTVTCASGAAFPFSSAEPLVLGEKVKFCAIGGIAGVYAIHVESVSHSHAARRATQARRPVWLPTRAPRLALAA